MILTNLYGSIVSNIICGMIGRMDHTAVSTLMNACTSLFSRWAWNHVWVQLWAKVRDIRGSHSEHWYEAGTNWQHCQSLRHDQCKRRSSGTPRLQPPLQCHQRRHFQDNQRGRRAYHRPEWPSNDIRSCPNHNSAREAELLACSILKPLVKIHFNKDEEDWVRSRRGIVDVSGEGCAHLHFVVSCLYHSLHWG